MISQRVKKLFKNVFTNKSDSSSPKQEPKKHPYLVRRQQRIESQKVQRIVPRGINHVTTQDPTHSRAVQKETVISHTPRKWKTKQTHETKERIQSNVNDLLKRALKEKSDKARVTTQPIQHISKEIHTQRNTPVTPIRPNGEVKLPENTQRQAPTTIDAPTTPMMNTDELSMRVNSIPIREKMEQDVYYTKYDNETIPMVYGIHDCIYKSVIRIFIWYRGQSNTTEPIETPSMRKHIDMIDMRVQWTEWIRIQRDLIHNETTRYKEHDFGRYSYPSWNTWRQCVRRIDNNRQLSTDTVALTIKETPTIQTMCQWLFDEYYMGCIVIPKIHIFTCLLIDSTLLLEWPFLFGVKDNHVYPIMNNSCCMDWIDKPSILETHYRNRRIKQKSFPTLEAKSTQEKLLGMTQRKYDFLIDKHTRRQYTLLNIQNELNTQDFVLVPFWSCDMMNTLRTAIYRMMRHSYAKKSSVFSKTWASHVESIFSFYEKEYTFMEI